MIMPKCINCGANLGATEIHCPWCGETTLYKKTQRTCINCGSPAAQEAQTCIMCGHHIDAIPQLTSRFSVSWSGVIIGLTLSLSLVYWFFQLQSLSAPNGSIFAQSDNENRDSVPSTPTPQPKFVLLTGTPGLSSIIMTLTPTPSPSLTPTPTATSIIYAVRRGDNLSSIAVDFDTTVDDLLALNKEINNNTLLRVDQEIILPPPDLGTRIYEHPLHGPVVRYLIKRGDTLSEIADKYETTISAIQIGNPQIDLNVLSVGQEIIVPLRLSTPTPALTPTPTSTFTPGPPYPAPILLYPTDQSLIESADTSFSNDFFLTWTSSGFLEETLFYLVILHDKINQETTHHWTKATSLRLSVQDLTPSTYTWRMVVVAINEGQDNTFFGKPVSQFSQERTFRWQ